MSDATLSKIAEILIFCAVVGVVLGGIVVWENSQKK